MWAILGQSSAVLLSHLIDSSGHLVIWRFCKEERLRMQSGKDINFWHLEILSLRREVRYWSPMGRDTKFGRYLNFRERRLLRPCHCVASSSSSRDRVVIPEQFKISRCCREVGLESSTLGRNSKSSMWSIERCSNREEEEEEEEVDSDATIAVSRICSNDLAVE